MMRPSSAGVAVPRPIAKTFLPSLSTDIDVLRIPAPPESSTRTDGVPAPSIFMMRAFLASFAVPVQYEMKKLDAPALMAMPQDASPVMGGVAAARFTAVGPVRTALAV